MQLKEAMSREIVVVSAAATVKEAAQLMEKLNVGLLPVTDDHRLVGTITDRDITVRCVAEGHDTNRTRVAEVMTPGVVYAYADDDLGEAARIMEEQQVRRIVVADRDDRPVGVVSVGDIATTGHDLRLAGEVLSHVSQPIH